MQFGRMNLQHFSCACMGSGSGDKLIRKSNMWPDDGAK